MTKSVSRIVVVVVALVATLAVFSAVDAQTYAPTEPRGSTYEPPVETANNGFLGFEDLNPVAGATSGGTGGGDATGDTSAGLAITGSEANLGLAIGIGLLAVGGTAVVAARKRDEE